tara:strand:- start:1382 stop:1765 length:384 start_codon:yes stop_codon:yes gene_type:complete
MELQSILQARLGRRFSVDEVALAFTKSRAWVYNNAEDLGGVKIGNQWQFFENNIVQALRPTFMGGCFAGKAEEQKDGKNSVVRQGQSAGRASKGKEISLQGESPGMGSFGQTETARDIEADPEGLLA